jgi:diguanylate cyclase (GGDEF)-like protein
MQVESRSVSEKLLRNQLNQRFATLKVDFDTTSKEKENALLLRENQSNQKTLAQERRVRNLQAIVIGLTVVLAFLLATLAVFQARNTRRMRKLAMTDELTGVPNRRAVLRELASILKREDAAPCSMLIIDIDHFKSINDHHGHPAGDEVLKVVADKVRASVHPPAFFGRLGGEEFLIVLPSTHIEDARSVADEFREQIASVDTARWFPDRRRITASIGVTTSTGERDTPSSMLQRADGALYVAKRSGRNCVKSDPAAPETSDWLLDAQHV